MDPFLDLIIPSFSLSLPHDVFVTTIPDTPPVDDSIPQSIPDQSHSNLPLIGRSNPNVPHFPNILKKFHKVTRPPTYLRDFHCNQVNFIFS